MIHSVSLSREKLKFMLMILEVFFSIILVISLLFNPIKKSTKISLTKTLMSQNIMRNACKSSFFP